MPVSKPGFSVFLIQPVHFNLRVNPLERGDNLLDRNARTDDLRPKQGRVRVFRDAVQRGTAIGVILLGRGGDQLPSVLPAIGTGGETEVAAASCWRLGLPLGLELGRGGDQPSVDHYAGFWLWQTRTGQYPSRQP